MDDFENGLGLGSGGNQSDSPGLASGVTLANQIPSQMLYYKILLDKHDYRQLNTLQDLNNQLKQNSALQHHQKKADNNSNANSENSQRSYSQDGNPKDAENPHERFLNGLGGEKGSLEINNKNYFVKFEHTNFSEQNIKAMAMLIMLLNRKNAIIKHLSHISTERKKLLHEQSQLKQALQQNP